MIHTDSRHTPNTTQIHFFKENSLIHTPFLFSPTNITIRFYFVYTVKATPTLINTTHLYFLLLFYLSLSMTKPIHPKLFRTHRTNTGTLYSDRPTSSISGDVPPFNSSSFLSATIYILQVQPQSSFLFLFGSYFSLF